MKRTEYSNIKPSNSGKTYVSTWPIVKKRKTHRNEPCPCGSKKKFKRCCLEVE